MENRMNTSKQLRSDSDHHLQEAYRILVEHSLQGLAIVQENRIVFANSTLAAMIGYSLEELTSFSPEEMYRLLYWEERELVQERIQNRLEGKATPARYEFRTNCKDGAVRWLELYAVMTEYGGKPAIQVTTTDITERKETEEALAIRLRYEEGLAACSQALVADGAVELTEALGYLLDASQASRVYIFENFEDPLLGLCMRQTHEVCSLGVVPEIDNSLLQYVPYRAGFERWQEKLSQGEPVQGVVKSFPRPERQILEPQDILSILVLPIWVGGKWYGFIGFDDTGQPRVWHEEDVRLLRTAAEIIGTYFERERVGETLRRYAERLETMHEIDQAILANPLPEAIAEAALNHLQRLAPYLWGSVLEFEWETGEVRRLAARDYGQARVDPGGRMSETWDGFDWLVEGQLQAVDDILSLSRLTPLEETLSETGIRSYIATPLIVQNRLIGSLYLGSAYPGNFMDDHVEIVQEVADSLAIAIQQARLYQQTRHDAETKAILLDEVNHRVKNNLAAILGILYAERRHRREDPSSTCKEVMEGLINRIQGLAMVHRLLSAAEWSPLLLSELAAQIMDAAVHALSSDKLITFEVSPSPVRVLPEQVSSLALVINELVTNSIKYTWFGEEEKKRPLHIAVSISGDEDRVQFQFRDNGPGYPEEVLSLKRYNVGLYLIQNIVNYNLKGKLTLYNDQGAVASILFIPGKVK